MSYRGLAGALALGALAWAQPAAAQFANPVLKIGVLTDESGPYADSAGPGSVLAAQMAVDDFGGAVRGHKIEIVHGDTLNKPDVAAGVARRWFDTEGVSAIVDLPVTPVALAVLNIAKEKKKSVMITASATAAFTAQWCTPVSTHWADDSNALAAGTAKAIAAGGPKNWYFLTVDIAFGAALQKAAADVIEATGGKVLGTSKHPVNAPDFSSWLLQAQSSGAQEIGLASVGGDLVNEIKQAHEFGIGKDGKQSLVAFLVYIQDIHALGLDTAQNLTVTSGYYWDQNEKARAFAKRFFEKRKMMPSKNHAEIYTAVLHYLQGVDKANSDDALAVNKAMRSTPVDYFGRKATLRDDGRLLYDLTLYRVKKPGESKAPWDYYAPVRDIPAAEAFLPMNPACKG